jgi:Mn2+/Fe2+ NRAMP family transporter
MLKRYVRWDRLFAIYFALGGICLLAALWAKPPLHDILLAVGVGMFLGFVPLLMAVYFLRGLLGIH